MEAKLPKPPRKWRRRIFEGILAVVILAAALYVAAILVFAIWRVLVILLRLFGLAPGGH